MPARSTDRLVRALLVPLLATSASAQDEGAGASGQSKIVPADSTGWQTLSRDLFVSGESSLVDPGRIEPLPRNIFKFGPVELLPKFDESVVYDDNVFLTDTGEEDDLIVRTGLGFIADYRFGEGGHRLSAGYDMERNWFTGGEARNFVEHFASGQLELNFNHASFTIGDRFEDRTDPVLAVFTGKIERTINTPHARFGWAEDTTRFELRAQRSTSTYDEAGFQDFDRDDDLMVGEMAFLVDEDFWIFGRADGMARTFEEDTLNDMTGVASSIGVRAKRGDELDGMARAGVRFESFDDDSPTDSDDSAVNPEAEARLRWWLMRTAAIEGRFEQTTEFSPLSNYQATTRGEVTWMQQLDERLSGRVGGGIEYVNPSSTEAPFIRYTAGAGLRYALLENADATLAWRMQLRNTRSAAGDYTGNQFTLGFSLRL